ncbi:hypothetical protein Tco_1314676 [Tanacetum coccineum]
MRRSTIVIPTDRNQRPDGGRPTVYFLSHLGPCNARTPALVNTPPLTPGEHWGSDISSVTDHCSSPQHTAYPTTSHHSGRSGRGLARVGAISAPEGRFRPWRARGGQVGRDAFSLRRPLRHEVEMFVSVSGGKTGPARMGKVGYYGVVGFRFNNSISGGGR